MLDNGTHGKPAGTVTDDTDLALCIARSLLEEGAFDGADTADRFQSWYEADPFDVGLMTANAIQAYAAGTSWRDAGREVWQHRPEGPNAGNGSVMRCVPRATAFAVDPASLVRASLQPSAITHHDPRCAVLNYTVAGFLRGEADPLTAALEGVGSDAPDELFRALRVVSDRTGERTRFQTGAGLRNWLASHKRGTYTSWWATETQ